MAWGVPDRGTADNDTQSVMFATDLDVLSAGIAGIDCVLFGLDFTGGSDMTPDISKGAVLSNGVMFAVAAASVTHTTADATNPRIDLVVVTSAGALAVRAGTAAASPKPPARTANDVVIRRVYIGANDTTISTAQSTDMRVIRSQGPITIAKVTTPVTFNTTAVQQTYFSVSIPDGLFLTGRILRLDCGGTKLNNGVTPTHTLGIGYGGTTVYSDATAALASSAVRAPWNLRVILSAVSSTSQKMTGLIRIGSTGAATTGSGDLSQGSQAATDIAGSASVDSDAANRTFSILWTHSSASATCETTMDHATLTLE